MVPQVFVAAVLVVYLLAVRLQSPKRAPSTEAASGEKPIVSENLDTSRIVDAGHLFGAFVLAARVGETCLIPDDGVRDVAAQRPHFGVAALAAGVGLLLWIAGERIFGRLLLGGSLLRANSAASGSSENMAAAIARAAHAVATALVVAKSLSGTSLASFATSVPFAVLGLVAVQVSVVLFRALTTYDDASQIASGNVAAALSYAGLVLAVAVVVAGAVDGDFTTWKEALKDFGKSLCPALAIFPIRQLGIQGLVLGARPTFRGGALDDAISRDRSVGIAAVEAASYVGAALFAAALL